MSENKEWQYLPAQTDLEFRIQQIKAEHNAEPRPSVVVHWGIEARASKLVAIYKDQQEGLHSLVADGTCSCGLQVFDDLYNRTFLLVTSPHHRNHITLEPEDPVFRGLVGKRHFAVGSKAPVDKIWDLFVIKFVAGSFQDKLFIPKSWTIQNSANYDVFNMDKGYNENK